MKNRIIFACLISFCMVSLTEAHVQGDAVALNVDNQSPGAELQGELNDISRMKSQESGQFNDYVDTEWYAEYVAKLVGIGGINGYGDGTFRPSGTITQAEFTAMLCHSIGIQAKDTAETHWSAGIVAAAQESGIVKLGELNSLDSPITRNEMARMIVRAVQFRKESVPEDYADYGPLLMDLSASPSFETDIEKVVALGIISGYPDKTFRGTKTLSRAEASVVVIRVLETAARKIPGKPSSVGLINVGETKSADEFISNLSSLSDYNDEIVTVTCVSADSIGMQLKTNVVGNRYIRINGRGGIIVIVQGGKSLVTFAGLYMPTYNETSYNENVMRVKIEDVDYFGFYGINNCTDIQIVKNPWKE